MSSLWYEQIEEQNQNEEAELIAWDIWEFTWKSKRANAACARVYTFALTATQCLLHFHEYGTGKHWLCTQTGVPKYFPPSSHVADTNRYFTMAE